RAACDPLREGRVLVAERRSRARPDRGCGGSRVRAVRLRLDRQQGGRLVDRPARVVGGRRGHRSRAALPGVVRQPAQVRRARTPNRVDVLGAATAATYEGALPLLLADTHVDAVIVLFVPPVTAGADEVAEAVARSANGEKPLLAVLMSAEGTSPALREAEHPVAAFAYPESAARALGRAAERADWLR